MKFKHNTIVVNDDGSIERYNPFGVFPIREDITIIPADEPKRLKLGWTVKEVIGVGISSK